MATCRACALLWLAILVFGCALTNGKETVLRKAQGQAGQEKIRQQWGEPTTSRSLESGESLWVYEKRELQPGNRMTASGVWCDEYALTFDERGILHHWTHRSYFHGGELMPKECVPK